LYYVRPPVCDGLHEEDTKYTNATSIVLYYRYGEHTILFTGDVTPEAMRIILNEDDGLEKRYTEFNSDSFLRHPRWNEETSDQPPLRSLLGARGLTVLVAPHHGLESCYCQEMFDAIRGGKPRLVVISERRKKDSSEAGIWPAYQSVAGASGVKVRIEGTTVFRRSITTVNGHHALIVLTGNGVPLVYADKNPWNLLEQMNG